MNNTFQKLKDRAEEFGVSRRALYNAIKDANGDMGQILKFLTEKKANTLIDGKETDKITSDRLFGEPPKDERIRGRGKMGLNDFNVSQDSNTGSVFQTVPTTRRYSQKRQLKPGAGPDTFKPGSDIFMSNRDKQRELHSNISSIKSQMHHERDEPFLFPSTEFDFDLKEAVQTSIKNYKKAKHKWDPATSSIRNQLF